MASRSERLIHKHRVPRREFVAWAAAIGASLTPPVQAALRLGSIPDAIAYLTHAEQNVPTERMSLFLGNHRLPESQGGDAYAAWDQYLTYGNLTISQWRDTERTLIAQRMQEAHAARKPYILVVDGQVPQMRSPQKGESLVSFPMIPLPPNFYLGKPKDMPDSFYVVSAEPLDRFGLQASVLFPNNQKIGQEVEAIGDEIFSRYDPYNEKNNTRENQAVNVEKARDFGIYAGEVGLLAAGAIAMKGEDATVKNIAPTATGAMITLGSEIGAMMGDGGQLAEDVGYGTSGETQRVETVIANATGEDNQSPMTLWAVARTALGVEKAQGILEHPTIYAKRPAKGGVFNPVPAEGVDLLFGSYHNVKAPQVMEDEGFRKQTINAFLVDLLTTAKKAIDARKTSSDPEIAKTFSDPEIVFYLLTTIAESLVQGTIKKITIPWGHATIDPTKSMEFASSHAGRTQPEEDYSIDPQKITDFENSHAEITQYINSIPVSQWVSEGLQAFLDTNHVPYNPSFFHPENTPTPPPPTMTPSPSAKRSRRDLVAAWMHAGNIVSGS